MQHLTLTNLQRESEADESASVLMVHFLFPNLVDAERALLVAMHYARRACGIRLNHAPGAKETDESERSFMELKGQILGEDFYNRLTPMQKEILQSHFFTVRFKEK